MVLKLYETRVPSGGPKSLLKSTIQPLKPTADLGVRDGEVPLLHPKRARKKARPFHGSSIHPVRTANGGIPDVENHTSLAS